MTRTLIALAVTLFATSALAQDYNRQDLVRGLCQKDGCDEFTILAADRIKTTQEGTLFRTRLKTFHASYSGRQDRGEENGYVFCSPTRPAIMAEQSGQTMAFFLAPFATQESRESVRKNANFHTLYFTICHGRGAGKAAVHNLAGVAQSHGYRVALAQSKLVPLKRAAPGEEVSRRWGHHGLVHRPPSSSDRSGQMTPPVLDLGLSVVGSAQHMQAGLKQR